MNEQKRQFALPSWPQKANELSRLRGLRRRLLRELELLNDLAKAHRVPTEAQSAFQVLDNIEWVMEQTPNSSPTFTE